MARPLSWSFHEMTPPFSVTQASMGQVDSMTLPNRRATGLGTAVIPASQREQHRIGLGMHQTMRGEGFVDIEQQIVDVASALFVQRHQAVAGVRPPSTQRRRNGRVNAWQTLATGQQIRFGTPLQHGIDRTRPLMVTQICDFSLAERVVKYFASAVGYHGFCSEAITMHQAIAYAAVSPRDCNA